MGKITISHSICFWQGSDESKGGAQLYLDGRTKVVVTKYSIHFTCPIPVMGIAHAFQNLLTQVVCLLWKCRMIWYRQLHKVWFWAGWQYRKKKIGRIMRNFWCRFFHVFRVNFFLKKYCSVRTKKLHKMKLKRYWNFSWNYPANFWTPLIAPFLYIEYLVYITLGRASTTLKDKNRAMINPMD